MAGKDEKFIKFYTTSILQSYDYQKMTLEEKGLYSHLLYLLAETTDGELIYDETLLAHQCGVSVRKFRAVFANISSKFQRRTDDENLTKIFNPKMKSTVLARQQKSEKLSDSGALGGKTTQAK
ncbi:MAG: hypothetical protein Q4E34_04665, partial [Synergistaceae bacterium]|nr:hypothetical protein [Synergistaceae bacterium]